MAQKKSSTKKPAAKKTVVTKVTTKKSPAKSTVTKRPAAVKSPVVRKKTKPETQSFKVTQETEPFLQFKLTRQTLYWLIIAAMTVGLAAWIYMLQADITNLYDQIETIRASEPTLPVAQPAV